MHSPVHKNWSKYGPPLVGFQKVLPVTQLFLQIQRISKVFPRNESESI